MKFAILIALALTLSGCGGFDRFKARLTGNATETCIDGVVYLQFTSGATIKYTYDAFGNFAPAKCN